MCARECVVVRVGLGKLRVFVAGFHQGLDGRAELGRTLEAACPVRQGAGETRWETDAWLGRRWETLGDTGNHTAGDAHTLLRLTLRERGEERRSACGQVSSVRGPLGLRR